MATKFLIVLTSGFLGLGYVLFQKRPLKTIFWCIVGFMFVRPLNFGDYVFNISFLLAIILIFLDPKIIFSSNSVKEWRLWYLVLFMAVINAILFGQTKQWFIGTEILSKAIDWVSKFFVVTLIASAVVYFVKTKDDLTKLMHLFLWSCFVFSFTATIAYFGFYDNLIIYGPGSITQGLSQNLDADVIYSEIYGISHSNLVFGVSALAVVFIPYLKWKAWQKYLLLTLVIFSVIISLKRVAIITLIFAILYYIIIEKRKGNNIWIFVIIIIILSIGSSYYDLIFKRFSVMIGSLNASSSIDSSTSIRFNRINMAWQIFLENPIFGQGAGYLVFVHNGFIEILGNIGILGLVLFKPLTKPLKKIKTNFFNPWAIAIIILMLVSVSLEAVINRTEIMYYVGLLYGGFTASLKINKNNAYS